VHIGSFGTLITRTRSWSRRKSGANTHWEHSALRRRTMYILRLSICYTQAYTWSWSFGAFRLYVVTFVLGHMFLRLRVLPWRLRTCTYRPIACPHRQHAYGRAWSSVAVHVRTADTLICAYQSYVRLPIRQECDHVRWLIHSIRIPAHTDFASWLAGVPYVFTAFSQVPHCPCPV